MQENKTIHIIGISGIGMSAIAKILHKKGLKISGSAEEENEQTAILKKMGIDVRIPHDKKNILGSTMVVYSTAVAFHHVELEEARRLNLPIYNRETFFPYLFGDLFANVKKIAISGTHGKTTTTTMVAKVFLEAKRPIDFLLGAMWNEIGSNEMISDEAEAFIIEADESDGSFLGIPSFISVVNNVDRDHLDFYKNMEHLKEAYQKFIENTDDEGCVFLGESAKELAKDSKKNLIIYGFSEDSHLLAHDVQTKEGVQTFQVRFHGKELGFFKLPVLGRHFVSNALVAIGVGLFFKIPLELIKSGLGNYSLPSRRMELKGFFRNIPVMDDYAHHPFAVIKTYEGLKTQYKKIIVIFQPHRYSRTKEVWDELIGVFKKIKKEGDFLILLPIYSAGETPIEGVLSEILAEEAEVFFAEDFLMAKKVLIEKKNYDLILSMGAGDITKFYSILMEEEKNQ